MRIKLIDQRVDPANKRSALRDTEELERKINQYIGVAENEGEAVLSVANVGTDRLIFLILTK